MKDSFPRFPYFTFSSFKLGVLRITLKEQLQLLLMMRYGGNYLIAIVIMLVAASGLIGLLLPSFVYQLVIDITSDTGLNVILMSVLYFAGGLFALQAAEIMRLNLGQIAAKRIDGVIRAQVRDIVLSSRGIDHLEQPEFKALVEKASDQGLTWRVRSAGTAAMGQAELIARMASALGMTIALAQYFPILAVSLLLVTLYSRAIVLKQWLFMEKFKDDRLADKKKVDYWAGLATTPEPSKEIRIFGLADWVCQKRLKAHYDWLSDYWLVRRKILHSQYFPAFIALLNGGLALSIPGMAAYHGELSVAELTACLVAAWGIFKMAYMGGEAFDIEYGRTAIAALNTLTSSYSPDKETGTTAGTTTPNIVFDNVSFTYPSSTTPVFNNLNLNIKAGERLAIVGSNGAGKTTLIKLLAGLYKADKGKILVNGQNVETLNMSDWRKHLSVLFQDFIRYPLSVRDNITAAAPEANVSDEEILELLRRCGVEMLLDKLDNGLDTEVWRTGTGGSDLSGGEWQKLALARVLFAATHGRKVIILDEPTAHMDVRAEVEFFDRVNKLAGDCSVIIISHRLSTVRSADRIVLLRDGYIQEQGSHAQLMKSDGQYAKLFNLQAFRFN